ncbi:MAG: 3-hydroxyacyl-CoA dehydrogenase family protein [Chloroflexi bacterium]|nr:3-hydroxyacyl-CoA dehydrogenase family protein [Chloroflexota bacterium]
MTVDDIKHIAVVGAGLMGHGIAQEFALAGYQVGLHDLTGERLQHAVKQIEDNLLMLEQAGMVAREQVRPALARVHTSTTLEQVVANADVVIEAVTEDLSIKQEIYGKLDRACPDRTIFASNTSTFMPSKLAAATHRQDRVLVAHYFNPPYLLPLVELVRSQETSDETVQTMYALLKRVGKRPVVVKKEVPGFIGNRLQVALFREALALVEQGIATPEDVDTVVKNSFGRRLAVAGPFEVFDMGGLDTILAVTTQLVPEISSSTEVPALLQEKVHQGELGVKSGKGFHQWPAEAAQALRQRFSRALLQMSKWP